MAMSLTMRALSELYAYSSLVPTPAPSRIVVVSSGSHHSAALMRRCHYWLRFWLQTPHIWQTLTTGRLSMHLNSRCDLAATEAGWCQASLLAGANSLNELALAGPLWDLRSSWDA